MSARARFIDRYPPYALKGNTSAAGVSFRRLKRQDHKRQREATKRAVREGGEPEPSKRSILWDWL